MTNYYFTYSFYAISTMNNTQSMGYSVWFIPLFRHASRNGTTRRIFSVCSPIKKQETTECISLGHLCWDWGICSWPGHTPCCRTGVWLVGAVCASASEPLHPEPRPTLPGGPKQVYFRWHTQKLITLTLSLNDTMVYISFRMETKAISRCNS